MGFAHAYRKAIQAVIRLGPPSVEDREVQSAVEHDLLAAGAGRFERTARIVEPNVHSLNEVTPKVYVIVFDEQDLAGKRGVAHQLSDLLQDSFARIIVGMGLAGKNELDRRLRIVDERVDHRNVLQNQIGALVSCKPASKPDSQSVEAQGASQLSHQLFLLAALASKVGGSLPGSLY